MKEDNITVNNRVKIFQYLTIYDGYIVTENNGIMNIGYYYSKY